MEYAISFLLNKYICDSLEQLYSLHIKSNVMIMIFLMRLIIAVQFGRIIYANFALSGIQTTFRLFY